MPLEELKHGRRATREKLNAPIRALNKGIVIETDDILVEPQPDGRVKLRLSDAFKERIIAGL